MGHIGATTDKRTSSICAIRNLNGLRRAMISWEMIRAALRESQAAWRTGVASSSPMRRSTESGKQQKLMSCMVEDLLEWPQWGGPTLTPSHEPQSEPHQPQQSPNLDDTDFATFRRPRPLQNKTNHSIPGNVQH